MTSRIALSMCKIASFATLCLGFVSCTASMPPAHFIIPAEFRGAIKIVKDTQSGVTPISREAKLIYEVPRNGILRLSNDLPLSSWQQMTAEFSDGTLLPTDTAGVHSTDKYSDLILLGALFSNEKGELWMYVGPLDELLAAHHSPLEPGKTIHETEMRNGAPK